VRITRVRVRNFRVHRDLDLELAPGLTVIRGPNEAGKSTLQRALEVGLFRRVTAGGSEIDSLRSWDAGEEGRPAVQLDFVQEDLEGPGPGASSRTSAAAGAPSGLFSTVRPSRTPPAPTSCWPS